MGEGVQGVVGDAHGVGEGAPAVRAGADVDAGAACGGREGRGGAGLPLSCMERGRVCGNAAGRVAMCLPLSRSV